MTYTRVIDSAIVPGTERGRLPDSERLLADPGTWVTDLPNRTATVQRSTGWYEVVDTPRPADTATHTFERSLTLVGGVPTETWTQRAWTAEELTARQHEANRMTIEQAIDAAIVELDNLIAAPALSTVASGTLTTAQLSTAVRTLRNEAQATRAGAQTVALRLKQTIKLVRGDYDTIT